MTTATNADLPRSEHPRPQWVRPTWLSLNGTWQFAFDGGDSGLERGLVEAELPERSTVPFAPESTLSGLGHVDFVDAVWYRRQLEVPADWSTDGRVLLHFGAVDYDTTVWVNGAEVGRHRGGFSSFSFDITSALAGERQASVTVRARDSRHGPQARGKQSTSYASAGAHYTRTTGIWQSVWLEGVPASYLDRPHITPDVAGHRFHVRVPVRHGRPGQLVTVTVRDGDEQYAVDTSTLGHDMTALLVLTMPAERVTLWAPGQPYLYDVDVSLSEADGTEVDRAQAYAGMRSVTIDGKAILINGERVFQRLVLDQGFWPDGILTAPSDDALRGDIELSIEAGFNGARLHQKVFEERYLYHADRLGYLVWGEFGDWGCSGFGPSNDHQKPSTAYVTEWLQALDRDHNHPAIIGWCPLNETRQVLSDRTTMLDDVTLAMFLATKAADPSRPVLDASGYSHRVPFTDVWDSHNYEQDPAAFTEQMSGLAHGEPYANRWDRGETMSLAYAGQPYFCSEFGGIWWNAGAGDVSGRENATSWGYGQRVRDVEEFHRRFEGLIDALTNNPDMFGYCYTQLTDVFQEENGIFDFARNPKFDLARIRAAQQKPPAHLA